MSLSEFVPANETVVGAPGEPTGNGQVIDHSVHGLVTIRLIGAPQSAVRSLVRILGQSQGSSSDEPDICITFTDHLTKTNDLRYIGLNEAAFDGDSFYCLDNLGYRTQIDFDRLGDRCELVCERGVSVIPHLVPILGLRLLRKGYVLLHSSAFVYEDHGILVTGWEKGGKTETLLPFMAAGAHYLADEWTIVSPTDGIMWGLSGMTQVWSWHFRYLPQYWARIRTTDRHRIRLVRLYQRLYHALPVALRGRGLPAQWLHRLSLEGGVPLLGQSRSAPEILFRDRIWQGPAKLDRLFLATLAPGETHVLPVQTVEIARRMIASLAYERRHLLNAYHQFRFAFPGRKNHLLETASEQELRLLSQAFAGRAAYEIRHPYPVSLPDLYETVHPYMDGNGKRP
jgi:hypothetical protein